VRLQQRLPSENAGDAFGCAGNNRARALYKALSELAGAFNDALANMSVRIRTSGGWCPGFQRIKRSNQQARE
jgi:hypothetical protein